jgi:hypothetical protein
MNDGRDTTAAGWRRKKRRTEYPLFDLSAPEAHCNVLVHNVISCSRF